jgi:hypothetical protein
VISSHDLIGPAVIDAGSVVVLRFRARLTLGLAARTTGLEAHPIAPPQGPRATARLDHGNRVEVDSVTAHSWKPPVVVIVADNEDRP